MSTIILKKKPAQTIDRQIKQARALLLELRETLEDLEDRRALAKAKKRNAGKPGIPWEIAAKELGIPAPRRKV